MAQHRSEARELLAQFDDIARQRMAPGVLGRLAAIGARSFFAGALGLHHRGLVREIKAAAETIGVNAGSLLLANLAYDLEALGCSTFVRDGTGGPLVARNLDWNWPGELLRRTCCVVRVRDALAGPYAIVGWPGFVGALTALAPGRFAMAVNYVQRRGAGLPSMLARTALGASPLPWAMRDVLDRARTFDEAVERVGRARLLSAALVTLAGTRPGEAVVVERAPCAAALRWKGRGDLCVANHYLSARFAQQSVDYDEGGSFERQQSLERSTASQPGLSVRDALEVLVPNIRPTTQYQAVMRAEDGLIVVRVPGGRAHAIKI